MKPSEQEYTVIVHEYAPMLFRYAYWLSGSQPVAQDLVQETLLRGWRSYESLENKESIKSWLIQILRRENARRFERKHLVQVNQDVDTFESTYGAIDCRPEVFALRQALKAISSDYREPLILQVLCGYTCKEIAEMLKLTPEAVMTRLHRARKNLRERLGEDESRPSVKNKQPIDSHLNTALEIPGPELSEMWSTPPKKGPML